MANLNYKLRKGDVIMFTVVLTSRNKDNKDLKDFRERKRTFLVREFEPNMNEQQEEVNMYDEFERFVQEGVDGEMSRLYISVNSRDAKKIQRDLFIELYDKQLDFVSFNRKLVSIANKDTNKASRNYLLDYDKDSTEEEMLKDIEEIKSNIKHGNMLEILLYKKTPNGYHIITNPFDVTAIQKDYITVKKDGMFLKECKRKNERKC